MDSKAAAPASRGRRPFRSIALVALLGWAAFTTSAAPLSTAAELEQEIAAPLPTPPSEIAPATPAPGLTGLAAEERQLVELINASRAEVGAAPLAVDERVMRVARWKADDMHARRYSAHAIPAGVCFLSTCWDKELYVWDALPMAGVHWANVAENVWLGPELGHEMAEVSNRVFLGSQSHRAATLEPVFTHVGIGMVPYPWTQGVHVVEVFVRLP